MLYDIAYSNNTFVTVGANGLILSSIDGSSWIQKNSGTEVFLSGITYSNHSFIAVGSFYTIIQSDPLQCISVTPTSYDFGYINVDSFSEYSFNISNTGMGDLIIPEVSVSGTDFSEFIIKDDQCSGKNIAPSASCKIDIEFIPTSASIKSALLSIDSDDPDTPNFNVLLNGTGVKLPDEYLILEFPASGATYTACSIYDIPAFKWNSQGVFKNLKIQFSKDNFTSISLEVPGKPGINEIKIKPSTWRKVLVLSGDEGGFVYWRVVGVKADKTQILSDVFSFIVGKPISIENPQISHSSKTTLPPPTLLWKNNCNVKFKIWFANDFDFIKPGIKKKALTFSIKNPDDNEGISIRMLTKGQWTAIRKLVGDTSGSSIYWHVESWDALKRYTKTEVMSFTLTD